MATHNTYILSNTQLDSLVKALSSQLPTKKIFTFSGTLGAGKTTLIQALGRSLGVTEPIQSPTYTYMNIYTSSVGLIYHFDLYRFSNYQEFLDAGFDEFLLEPHSLCFIEWPEIVLPHIDKSQTCTISIDYQEKKRCYTLSY